jgi:hypothetical protein
VLLYERSIMSETLNTTPLFPTSLRRWQAAWRAGQGLTADSGERPVVAVRPARFKKRNRKANLKSAGQ